MRGPAPRVITKSEIVVVVIIAASVVALVQNAFYTFSPPTLDALRYADYALNIHEHGVFGLSGRNRETPPAPGYANSPLYPMLVAFAMHFDPELRASIRCVVGGAPGESSCCSANYRGLLLLQGVLATLALVFLWGVARKLFRHWLPPILTVLLALASTKLLFYANHLLTEILVLVLFAWLMFELSSVLRRPSPLRPAIGGFIVGALTLTRPEYLYLGYALIVAGAVFALSVRRRHAVVSVLAFSLAFAVTLTPWLARNHHHFNETVVTGGYGDTIVAYRTAYNRMSLIEWCAAFVYWLPGHGEALAQRFLPPASYANLGTGPDSYLYREGGEIFRRGLEAVDNDRERLTGYLIRKEIIGQPLKHLFSSIPLAWRGVLAGKYLAVAGLPCLLAMVIYALRRRNMTLLMLVYPALVMIGLYAAISVSIPRYNVYLIYYYAIAVAWALAEILSRIGVAGTDNGDTLR